LQVRLLLVLVHVLHFGLHLLVLLVLLLLYLLVVPHSRKEVILKSRNVQVLQKDSLVVLFQLRHQLRNLLLVDPRRLVVKQGALD
jgi:hypothetical protein